MHRPTWTTAAPRRFRNWALALALAAPFVAQGTAQATTGALSDTVTASLDASGPADSLAERHAVVRGLGSTERLHPLQRLARVPRGYVAFCQLHPQDCVQPRPRGATRIAAPITLDAQRLAELDAVNRAVNAAVHPITDQKLYGRIEEWTYPRRARLRLNKGNGIAETIETLAGDCEDYVLMKRAQLLALGWPAHALLITVVRDLEGLGHAVLTARTDAGDIILDNQAEDLAHWKATGYAFIKRQSARDPNLWVSLGTPVAPAAVVGNTD
ncbi:MAG: transglutaminase-like cysteine peptidase [Pseudomonadota bacterium]